MEGMTQYKVMAIIILLVVVGGCGAGKKTEEKDPLYGTQGLVLNFVRGAPPSEVYEGDQIEIAIELENKGATAIDEGYLNVITENQYINLDEYDHNFVGEYPLEGRTLLSQVGDKRLINLFASVGDVDSFSGVDTSIIAEACYRYETKLSTEVCIDTNQYDNSYEKPCQVKDLSFSGQGAPIAIKKVETRITPRMDPRGVKTTVPQFLIYIKKVQQGSVINPDKLYDICGSGYVDKEDFGRIIVEGKLANKDLVCNPGSMENPLRLSENMGEEFQGSVVRCTLEGDIDSNRGTYTSILNLKLSYGFSVRAKNRVRVLNT